jgi:ribonuclease HII
MIAGIDEAGRGPLAGPVAAAAVILPETFSCSELKDSKQLSYQKRTKLFSFIQEKAISIGIGMIDADEIDEINILQATFKAMRRALETLSMQPEEIFVDGNKVIPHLSIPQTALVKGDTFHPSIMCASIIAKVMRDRWMEKAHEQFPEYGFNRHKGYGTRDHLKALELYGPCAIHRRSFYPVKLYFFDSSSSIVRQKLIPFRSQRDHSLKGFQQMTLNFTEV